MKGRFQIAALLLAALPLTAVAQRSTKRSSEKEVDPPAMSKVLAGANSDPKVLALLLVVKTQLPLGPDYVLQGYEGQMTLVSQNMSVELQSIERALHSAQITRPQAEYLIQQRYQVAMMRYEVLTALHDALEEDIQQVAAKSRGSSPDRTDNTVAATHGPVSSLEGQ